MKFFHLSDKEDLRFRALYDVCDVLIATGDLGIGDFPGLAQEHGRKQAFGVYGNHCRAGYLEALGIENVHGRVVTHEGLRIGGFEGCPRYKPGPFQFDEADARAFARDFPPVDVLLLHAGPLSMLDEPDPKDPTHTGSEAIRDYILRCRPAIVFVGHQYSNGDLHVGFTRLYRSYQGRLIDIDPRVRPTYPAPIPGIPAWMDDDLLAEQAEDAVRSAAETARSRSFPARAISAARHLIRG